MAYYRQNPNEWRGKGEWSIALELHGNTVTDGEKTNPAIQALLPLIAQLHDPNPELVIRYEYHGWYERDTWSGPGGTFHEVWPIDGYLYVTQTGLTDLEDQPSTSTDPEYEGLHLQDQFAQPGEPQEIPLDKETVQDLFDTYEKEIYENDNNNNDIYDDIQRLAQSITEDPDIIL